MTIKQVFYSLLLCSAVIAPTLKANIYDKSLELIRQQKTHPRVNKDLGAVTYTFPIAHDKLKKSNL